MPKAALKVSDRRFPPSRQCAMDKTMEASDDRIVALAFIGTRSLLQPRVLSLEPLEPFGIAGLHAGALGQPARFQVDSAI